MTIERHVRRGLIKKETTTSIPQVGSGECLGNSSILTASAKVVVVQSPDVIRIETHDGVPPKILERDAINNSDETRSPFLLEIMGKGRTWYSWKPSLENL